MDLKKTILYYLLYTFLLAGVAMVVKQIFPEAIVRADQFWLIFGFLGGLTFIAYILAYVGIKKSHQTGVFSILGSIVLKMLFAMSFVLVYSLKHQGSNMIFALNFFSLYLLFTLFEILGLLRNLRHQNK
ncbi:hypothetical protein [Pedobacter sp. ASV28]|uniref:hypothetical protein n=1 Tax=Pedobacter sp. ASV28 TaxID=2795123 RepID=UPI0018EDB8FB